MKTTSNTSEASESESVLRTRKEHAIDRLYKSKFSLTAYFAVILSCIVIASITAKFTIPNLGSKGGFKSYIWYLLGGTFSGVVLYSLYIFGTQSSLEDEIRKIDVSLAALGADQLKEEIEDNFFTKLVQINFKYIDQYYLQTQEQANKSFRLASMAAIAGPIIILVGIGMMYTEYTEPAYVTTGAGLISEFIAAIFFYLYNRTILKMSQYHQKLVITQNISLALKITDDMQPDSKTRALEMLIDRLTFDVNKHLTGSL